MLFVKANPLFRREMFCFSKRIQSFINCANYTHSANEMASCGLFYCPHQRQIYCFACGFILKKFLVEDNIWAEHELANPKCGFISLNGKPVEVQRSEKSELASILGTLDTDLTLISKIHKP
jgi:hypothetical protein